MKAREWNHVYSQLPEVGIQLLKENRVILLSACSEEGGEGGRKLETRKKKGKGLGIQGGGGIGDKRTFVR